MYVYAAHIYIFVECQFLLGLANSPQSAKAETINGPLRGRTGMPPEAKAKGVAAKALAKAAFAGKAKAQSAGLVQGRGAGPQGTLPPSGPAPVATRRWVHCAWDADYYRSRPGGPWRA